MFTVGFNKALFTMELWTHKIKRDLLMWTGTLSGSRPTGDALGVSLATVPSNLILVVEIAGLTGVVPMLHLLVVFQYLFRL